MSQPASPASAYPAPRRRRWPLFIPVILVALLAVGWSAVWFYAQERAEEGIADWRAREKQAGRLQDCASQSIGGYPFRIEVSCSGARFELAGTPTLQLKLPALLAAVQVYDPKLLIAEFTGPLEVSEPGRPPSAVIDWKLAQASVRGLPAGIERASLAIDAPVVHDRSRTGDDVVFKAQHVELHGRQAAEATSADPAIEAVVRLNGAVADKLHPLAGKPLDAEIATVLHGVDDIAPKPWPVRLKEWQARGGRLEIINARVAQEGIIAVGAGTLALTARGGLDGNLQVTVVGIEKLLKLFDIDRIMSEGQVGATLSALDRIVPGLGGIARQNAAPGLVAALGKRTELDGKPAVAFPVRFVDGTVFLGPFQVGMVAPLF
jgi:hypothetical protein